MRAIKNVISRLYQWVFQIGGYVIPKNSKTVIFESFLGKQFSDNPKAIYDYMKINYPHFKLIWSFDKRSFSKYESENLIKVKRFSFKWLYYMNRAKYWVSNSRLPLWIPKPKGTVYLQTWHGTPLKKLGSDINEIYMPGTNTEKYKRNFLKEAGKWDYLISPNAYTTKIFKRAFNFNKNIIETGYPRNDFLINSNNEFNINGLKKKIKIPFGKKVILYAPTWRDNQYYEIGRYKFKLELDLDLLRKNLGNDYIIILRLHYLVAENLDLSRYEGFIYDFSHHEDIKELYLMADLLITDYSSVFFDYANLKRPMLFYVYDIEEYRDKLRGFYFDFESRAPGPLVRTTSELIDKIKDIENEMIHTSETFVDFYNQYCYLEDGKASQRVVHEVFGK